MVCFDKYFLLQTELPNDVDIDLDEILDIEDENQRKKFIRVSRTKKKKTWIWILYLESLYQDILNGSKSSKEIINVSEQNISYLSPLHSSQSSRFLFVNFQKFIDDLLERAKTLWSARACAIRDFSGERRTFNGTILSFWNSNFYVNIMNTWET